ncbi:hypothetical protein K3495_g2810 [Podosphaera aphanis]|nr:hypothetical protein K3495_g2810 [Podosphaera aphanis]
MNTVKSFWVGWSALCVAGGGAYYFAKKSINADKMARFEAEQKRKRQQDSLEYSARASSNSNGNLNHKETHEHHSESPKEVEKSKYEPEKPFRSLKGDRFS